MDARKDVRTANRVLTHAAGSRPCPSAFPLPPASAPTSPARTLRQFFVAGSLPSAGAFAFEEKNSPNPTTHDSNVTTITVTASPRRRRPDAPASVDMVEFLESLFAGNAIGTAILGNAIRGSASTGGRASTGGAFRGSAAGKAHNSRGHARFLRPALMHHTNRVAEVG
jgi:hypothetical protein